VKVRFVGLNGPIVIPDLGGLRINTGDIVEVPDSMAGRPPSPLVELDMGAGLLEQVDNWQPVVSIPKPPKTTEKE
jgi:hypothetical protein